MLCAISIFAGFFTEKYIAAFAFSAGFLAFTLIYAVSLLFSFLKCADPPRKEAIAAAARAEQAPIKVNRKAFLFKSCVIRAGRAVLLIPEDYLLWVYSAAEKVQTRIALIKMVNTGYYVYVYYKKKFRKSYKVKFFRLAFKKKAQAEAFLQVFAPLYPKILVGTNAALKKMSEKEPERFIRVCEKHLSGGSANVL